jgi:hypothetical protein
MELRGDDLPTAPPPPPDAVPLPPPPPGAGRDLPGSPGGPGASATTDAVLRIPLGIRALLRQSLDLLTRRDAGLRGASFYIGFIVLLTVGPMIVVAGLALTDPTLTDPAVTDPAFEVQFENPYAPYEAWFGWLLLAIVPGLLGYLVAGVEARSLATAVIGGRVEGRPLRLRESIALARARFWQMLGAQVLIGILAAGVTWVVQIALWLTLGPVSEAAFGISLFVTFLLTVPFVYVPAGIVLGEVNMFDAIGRSWRLVRRRWRLAIVVALFSVIGQFVVLFGLSAGLDIVARVLIGTGVVESFPRPLVVPVAAIFAFAIGTLMFLVETIAAAPAVHAFAALTHYTRGLQDGRDAPVRGTGLFSPWMTPGLAAGTLIGLLALVGAVLSLAG